jgi:hypothetical protein
MKKILMSILLLIPSILFAQNSVCITIIDSISKQAIPFIKIHTGGKDRGYYSDHNGFININNLSDNDTLYIVDIFYEHKFLPIKTLQKNQQILLSPNTLILNEAVVKPFIEREREKEKEIGYAQIRPNTNYFNAVIGTELAFLIEYKNIETAYIKDIIIKVKKNTKNNPLIRIHLYHDEKGKPGEEIYLKDNLITISNKNMVKFNIKNQNIQLPENGIFVALEWTGKLNENGKIFNDNSYFLNPRINVRSTNNTKIKGKGFTRIYGNWKPLLIKSIKGKEEFYIPLYGLIIEEQK